MNRPIPAIFVTLIIAAKLTPAQSFEFPVEREPVNPRSIPLRHIFKFL